MIIRKILVAFATATLLVGCTPPDRYPISGEECSADDPVHDIDANDCTVP